MLHPDLQAWLLDKERRIIELERWRRTKADPMLDDHERRIGSCESQISSLWSKLGDVEDDINKIKDNDDGKYYIDEFEMGPRYGFIHFSNKFQMCWLDVHMKGSDRRPGEDSNTGTVVPLILPTGRVVTFNSIEEYECIMTTDERGEVPMFDQLHVMYCRPFSTNSIKCSTYSLLNGKFSTNNQTVLCWGIGV
jgi:hypothetical protein